VRIYLCTDMEGASGVTMREEIEVGAPRYEFGRRMLSEDVAAAVEGFKGAGATRIVVLDGHGGGGNFVYERLPAGAEYVCGRGGTPALPFLDDSFDAVGFVGQHARAGTPNAFWPHTQSWDHWLGLWANDVEIGEIGQFAIAAGHYGLPVIFLSGDRAAAREVEELCGEVETVAVKEGASATRGVCLALPDAHRAIYEGAKRSVRRLGKAKPYRVSLPLEVKIRFTDTNLTKGPVSTGAELVDPVTIRRLVDTPLDIYRV